MESHLVGNPVRIRGLVAFPEVGDLKMHLFLYRNVLYSAIF